LTPGNARILTVVIRAITEISQAHAAFYVQTQEGQPLFNTASSRYTDATLALKPGERAVVRLDLDLNLQSGVFRLGFALTDNFDERFLYCNMNLKQVVMTGNAKSQGLLHLNPDVSFAMSAAQEEQGRPQAAR